METTVAHLEVLGNLTNETLEGELADEQLGGLLVATNLAEGDGTRPEAMGLLHATSRRLEYAPRVVISKMSWRVEQCARRARLTAAVLRA